MSAVLERRDQWRRGSTYHDRPLVRNYRDARCLSWVYARCLRKN